MKPYIRKKMNGRHPGILRNRPNKLAQGISAGLYTKTQKYKGKGASGLSDVAILSLYGTLDSLRNWKATHIALKPKICPCCGHTSPQYAGLSNRGKRRLEQLRAKYTRVNLG